MKKVLSIALVVTMLLSCVAAAVPVSAAISGDYEYSVNDDGTTATVTKYNGTETNVVIPSVIKGYKITKIGNEAFDQCTKIAFVTIPEGVTSIGSGAFKYCTSLASVTIPEGVTSIGYYAFYGCTSLSSVTISEGVTSIGNFAFEGCTSLTSVTIPSSVTSIGSYAFEDCTSLASVTIPASVTSIGSHAFEKCTSLASVTILDGVTNIGWYAFYGCTSLKSITIPEGVTSIGGYTFYNCSSLASVTIPESVTSIGNYAFYNCTSLASITIPEGVTSIGEAAFYKCTSLTSVTIPEGVTSIGDYAFEDCTSLESVTIPASVTSIGEYAFDNCTSLASVTIPEGVTSIGYNAFNGCTSLSSVMIPESVTSIGDGAFSWCGLKHVLYAGTKEEWKKIVFGSSNDSLKNAVRHYSCGSAVISSVVFPPTCLDKGYTKCRCTVCGYEYNSNYTQALGHSYEVITVVEPTCVNQGYAEYRCSVCGFEYTNYTDALGHKFVDGSCSKCGMLKEDCIESAHDYANNCDETWTIYKPEAKWMAITFNTSTETEYGDYIYIYDAEDNQIGRYSGDALAGKRIVIKSDTVKIRLTSNSSGVYYGFALSNVEVYYEDCGHSHTEIRGAIEPTCVTAGSKGSVYCFDCDTIIIEATVIPATGLHEMTQTVIEPSCTADGYTWHCCSVCGYSYTSDIVPARHSVVLVKTVSPDCINQGYDIYRCSVCGEEYCTNYTSSFGGHTFENGVCISCRVLEEDLIESEHDYADNSDLSWEINKPHAKSITITFSDDTYTESYYDFIYIYDANDTLIGKYSDSQLASQSVTVEGNTVKIRLTSDGAGTGYGFRLINVAVVYPPIIEGVIIDGEIEEGAQLYVARVDISDINISDVYIYDMDSALVYDIYIEKDGNRIQSTGQTVISIPVPDTMNGEKCKVIYIDDSGNITDMNAVFENGFMTFTTEHFSYFALVEKTDVLLGDINADGIVTLKDVLIARKYVAGVASLTDEEIYRGDINGDGVLTLKDVLTMRKMVAGVL